MDMTVNGYILERPLSTNNAGNCKWGFAEKNDRRFFIKEFLDPVYPAVTEGLSEDIVERKREICREYEARRAELYKDINESSHGGLQHIEEFFRYGSHYYITMDSIQEITKEELPRTPFTDHDKVRIGKVLIHNLARLHQRGIIHGDIKVDNILFYKLKSGMGFSAKVVDFDDAFRIENAPENIEDIHGDQVYMAPETYRFMLGAEKKLSPAIDTFALGLVLYQLMMKMKLPGFDKKRYTYPFEALVNNEGLELKTEGMPKPFDAIIPKMLIADPMKRISLADADAIIKGEDNLTKTEKEIKQTKKDAGVHDGDKKSVKSEREISEKSTREVSGLVIGTGFEKIFGEAAEESMEEGKTEADATYFSKPDDI